MRRQPQGSLRRMMIIGYRAHLDGMAGTGSGTQTTANAALRVDDQLAGHRVNRQALTGQTDTQRPQAVQANALILGRKCGAATMPGVLKSRMTLRA